MIQNLNALLSFIAFTAATITQAYTVWRWRNEDVPVIGKALLGVSLLISLYLAAAYGYIAFIDDAPGFGAKWLRPALLGVAFIVTVEAGYMLSFFRLMNERRDFISRASHELRTPLTAVYGYLELASQKYHDDELINVAYMAAERLKALIENFAIVQGNGRHYVVFDLREIVDTLCMRQYPGVTIICQQSAEPMPLKGSQTGLTMAIGELFDNAAKFGALTINVRVYRIGRTAAIKVTDNGIGIADISRIWEPSHQESQGNDRLYAGIGYGLTIARQVIESHGGRIEVESGKSWGSTFTVYLPLASQD